MRNLSQRSKQTEAFTACTNIWLHAISYKIAIGYKIVMHGITTLYVAIHLHTLYSGVLMHNNMYAICVSICDLHVCYKAEMLYLNI